MLKGGGRKAACPRNAPPTAVPRCGRQFPGVGFRGAPAVPSARPAVCAASATACARPAGVRDLAPGGRRERLQQAHHLHQPLPLAQALLLAHQPARPPAVQGGLLRGTSSCRRSPPLPDPPPSSSWTTPCRASRGRAGVGRGLLAGSCHLSSRPFSRRSPAGRCTPSACASPRARPRARRRS